MKNDRPITAKTRSASPSKTSPATAKKKAPAPEVLHRRDATGHLNPAYAASLRSIDGKDKVEPEARAFLHHMRSSDSLAEQVGEAFVRSAISGEYNGEDAESVAEEVGGPFIETRGSVEFADGTDPSNPEGATREPFPKT